MSHDINEDIMYTQYAEPISSGHHARHYPWNAQRKTSKEDLEAQFTDMLDEFGNSICKVPLSDLHRSVAILPESIRKDLRNPSEAIRSMIKTESTLEFLAEITVHSNYLKPSLLQYMVARHSRQCRKKMDNYLQTLQVYKESTTIEEHTNQQGNAMAENGEFTDMLGSDWRCNTIEDLIQHFETQLTF